MAAKKQKTKSVAKKTTESVLKSTKPAKATASAGLAAFKSFPQFGSFPKMPSFSQFSQLQSFPQMQPFKMETNMFKGNKQFEKITQDAAVAGQDQVDALVKSSTIFTKGMEDIIKTCMEIAQESGEKSASMTKSIMACKTLNEFTEVQTRLTQSSFDELMNNVTKISEMSVKLYTEAFAPINDQMGKVIKRASDMAA